MKVLIVGGVAGGAGCAARLRRNDETAEIIMFEKGPYISFANCGLPYYIGEVITDKAALQLQTPERFHDRFQVDVRVMHEVLSVDSIGKKVLVKDHLSGKTYEESFDRLLLSPGASPIRPKLPGIDREHVFTLRNIPDTYAIKDFVDLKGPKTAAVIGGGFIGLEVAENLRHSGLEVTIIEATSHVIAALDPDMAHDLHNHIRSKGVGLLVNSTAASIEEHTVTLSDGTIVPADLVILSVGVRPETGFLKDSGIALGSRGEILVDEKLETNVKGIYAVGDAIATKNIVTGEMGILPLASPANRQARIVADSICGYPVTYSGVQGTSIAKVFDMTAAVTGESETSLRRRGAPYRKVLTFSAPHASYYPGGTNMFIKTLFDPKGTVLGAQIVGYEGVDKRIDLFATAVRHQFTVYDLQELELSYAPPFSSAKDPVNMAGYAAANILEGRFHPFFLEDLDSLPKDAQLLDVRTPMEFEMGTIPGAFNLELDRLRTLCDQMDRSRPVYLFCQVGLRGYLAERILSQHGFNDVHNLSGGFRIYAAAQADARGEASDRKEYADCGMEK